MMDLVAFLRGTPCLVDLDLLNMQEDELDDSLSPTPDPLHDFVPVEELAADDSDQVKKQDKEGGDENPHGLTPAQYERYQSMYEELTMSCSAEVADMLALGVARGRLTLVNYDMGGVASEEFDSTPLSHGSFGREHVRPRSVAIGEFRDRGPRRSVRPSVGLPDRSHVAKRAKPSRDTVRGARVRADVAVTEERIYFFGLVAEVHHA
jgi:hypothetical protein